MRSETRKSEAAHVMVIGKEAETGAGVGAGSKHWSCSSFTCSK